MAFTKSKKEKLPAYEEFLESTKGKQVAPIYLLCGAEEFFINECLHRIVDSLLTADTKAFNYDVLYGSKVEAKDVLAIASSYPMMCDRRVVIVKEFEKLVGAEQAKELFSAYIAKPLESTCLVMISEEPDFRTRPFNELKKRGMVYQFPALWDNQIPSWIAARCTSLGKTINDEACHLLQSFIGNSLLAIQNEIDKLITALGERKEITTNDITTVVGISKEFTVFELQNAVGKKDLDRAIYILRHMLDAGESTVKIIVMLTKYFSTLWKIQGLLQQGLSESAIAAEIKMSPFILKNYLPAATLFSSHEFEKIFPALLDADIQLKSTSPDQNHLMELLLYTITHPVAVPCP